MKTPALALVIVSLVIGAPVIVSASGNAAELPMAQPPLAAVTVAPAGARPLALGVQGKHPDVANRFEPPRERTCFGQAETREKITSHRLTEPFGALRAGRLQGEALRAKLCRWKPDEFVYEVSVLRRDGRIAHVYMNAQNGQPVGLLADPDRN